MQDRFLQSERESRTQSERARAIAVPRRHCRLDRLEPDRLDLKQRTTATLPARQTAQSQDVKTDSDRAVILTTLPARQTAQSSCPGCPDEQNRLTRWTA